MIAKTVGVHLTTDGYEYDRLVIPMLKKYPVEKLVVLRSDDSPYADAGVLTGKFLQKVVNTSIDVELVNVDLYDFNDVFINTLIQIKKYASDGKYIYINISPVPKLASVAMISAAFLSEFHDRIEIFYAKPEEYLTPKIIGCLESFDDKKKHSELEELHELFMKKGIAVGVKEYLDIPLFPIKNITDVDREILRVLKDNSGVDSIDHLVNSVNRIREDEITRSSIQYRLERLVDNGLVDTEREGRRLKIYLNKLGEIYLESSSV